MKILYAIQGTGNGHISRARDIIPCLQTYGEVDILISGTQADTDLPYAIKYRFNGLSFVFGKKGGIDYVETYKKSSVKKLFREIKQLPVREYDLVISDFEPVSAWACFLYGKKCIGLSNQLAVVNKNAPQSRKKDIIGKLVLKYYAPVKYKYGFHYLPYGKNIFTPVIRQQVRDLKPTKGSYYTVYLPAHSDKRVLKFLQKLSTIQWQVFSKHAKQSSSQSNVTIFPINNESFLKSIEGAKGVLCAAGFQTTSEVIYLKKKLLVIPMKGQYEQQCNAAALQMLGITVMQSLKAKQEKKLVEWLESNHTIDLNYPNDTAFLIQNIIDTHSNEKENTVPVSLNIESAGKFRKLLLHKIFTINA